MLLHPSPVGEGLGVRSDPGALTPSPTLPLMEKRVRRYSIFCLVLPLYFFVLDIGIWNLEFVWNLEFEIWNFILLWSLVTVASGSETLFSTEKIFEIPLTGRCQYVIQVFEHEICRETGRLAS